MSYYTRVRIELSDASSAVDEVASIVRSWLTAQRVYAVEDVLEDFRRGWIQGETDFNNLVCEDIEEMMANISTHYPELRIYVRGMGEEFHDVWLRIFENRKAVFKLGPFEQFQT